MLRRWKTRSRSPVATRHMANESPGHTLGATALVHEAYLRLVGPEGEGSFANRGHFFAAAAEAMRHILVDWARRKRTLKRGAGAQQVDLDPDRLPGRDSDADADTWIDFDEALTALAAVDESAAELAKLRVFGGLTVEEAGEALGMARATAFRAWLTAALADRP